MCGVSTASHRAKRTLSACAPVRSFATRVPSIMSAKTAAHGRSRITIEIETPPGRRRIVREYPESRGGDVNDGGTRPHKRADLPRSRAAPAKRIDVDSIILSVALGCDTQRNRLCSATSCT